MTDIDKAKEFIRENVESALIFQHGDTRTKRDRDREQFLGFCKIGAKLHCLNF